jgi:hypothetical protein
MEALDYPKRDDAPECHRRDLGRSPLVARIDSCGAMARLIG